jgi:hypothetical protein
VRFRLTFVLAAGWVAVAGCGTTINYVPLNNSPRPMAPRPPQSVEMFTTGRPDRPFVEVAAIEAQQQPNSIDTVDVIYAKMRDTAARVGCDGLVIVSASDTPVTSMQTYTIGGAPGMAPTTGMMFNSRTLKGYRAACIMFRDVASAPPPPAGAPAPPVSVPPAASAPSAP